MLGAEGFTDSIQYAILLTNYMKLRFEKTFDVVATDKHNKCPHEFFIDSSCLVKRGGITEEHIIKRLENPRADHVVASASLFGGEGYRV